MGVLSKFGDFVEGFLGAIFKPIKDWLQPDAPDKAALKVSRQGSNLPIPVVYGRQKLGVIKVHKYVTDQAGGASNEYLHLICVICEGEIDAVEKVYFDGKESTDKDFEVRGVDYFRIRTHLGSETQVADPVAVSEIPNWTSNHRLQGLAYLYVRLRMDKDQKTWRGEPDITVVVRGRKVKDTRTGLTAWSQNNAMILRDYCTNQTFGLGLPESRVDDAAFEALADTHDIVDDSYDVTTIAYEYDAESRTHIALDPQTTTILLRRFTCNLVIDTEQEVEENIREILSSFRGILPPEYVLSPTMEDVGSPTESLDREILIGDIEYDTGTLNDAYNHVSVRFPNEKVDFEYEEVSFPDKSSALYNTWRYVEDDGKDLPEEFTFDSITNKGEALKMAQLIAYRSRFNGICKVTTQPAGLKYREGSLIGLTDDSYGFVDKPFRIIEKRIAEDGTVEFTLREHENSIYPWSGTAYEERVGGTFLGNPADIPEPDGLTFTQEVTLNSAGKLSWNPAQDLFVRRFVVKIFKIADEVGTTISPAQEIYSTDSIFTEKAIPFLQLGGYRAIVSSESTIGTIAESAPLDFTVSLPTTPSAAAIVYSKPGRLTVKPPTPVENSTYVWEYFDSSDPEVIAGAENAVFTLDGVKDNVIYTFRYKLKNALGTATNFQEVQVNGVEQAFETWIVYADDTTGTNATLDPSQERAYYGIQTGKLVKLTNLNQVVNYANFEWVLRSAGGTGNGAPAISIVLSNESHVIPTDSDGNNGDYTGASTQVSVLIGSVDDTSAYTISVSEVPDANITGSLNPSTNVYTLTNLTVDQGYIDITATRVNYPVLTKRFSVSKARRGVNGSPGQNATVSRSGNVVTITAANGSVQVFDGNDGGDGTDAPIPTFTNNPDGSVTINPNTGAASLTIPAGADGSTPVLNVDYFVAGGNYVSNIFTNATSRPATPTGGTFNGSSETFPTGWTDNPTDYTPPQKRWVSTRQYERNPVNGAWSAVGAWSTPALQGEKGDTGDTGITASVLTPSGRQWSIDADGNFSPSQTASLPFTVIFYKNGTQVASGTVNVAVTTAGNLTSGTQSLGAGVGFSISGTNLRARTYSMTYQDVTASASFAVVQDGANGASVTVTNTSTDANGNTVVTFSDGSSVTVNKGEDGAARGVQPIYANDTVGNGRDLSIGSREFVNFYEWIGTPLVAGDTLPNGLTYVRFRGEDGSEGIANGVVPIYATNAAGSSASFTQGTREYVNFYEWTVAKPTTVPSGLTYLKIVGPTGPQGPAGPQGPIGPSAQDLYDQEKNAASSSTNVGGWVTLLTMNPAQGVGTFNQTFTVSLAGSLLSNALEPQPITSYFEINFLSGASVVGSGTATSSTSENPFINYVRTPADYSNSSGASYSIRARMIQVGSGTVGSGGWNYNASWVLKRN